MPHFEITGGTPLHGSVQAAGSKNAALPIMAAAILADELIRLERVPTLTDVQTLSRVLQELGLRVTVHGPLSQRERGVDSDGVLHLETVDPAPVRANEKFARRMRASFCVLGPLLAKRHQAIVPLPGGCNIGNRPVDLHLKGLAALGADIRLEHGCVVA